MSVGFRAQGDARGSMLASRIGRVGCSVQWRRCEVELPLEDGRTKVVTEASGVHAIGGDCIEGLVRDILASTFERRLLDQNRRFFQSP